MARTDRSATRTPMSFIAIALSLVVLRVGLTAASASAPSTGQLQPTPWKAAADADKDLLPGTEDVVEEPVSTTKRAVNGAATSRPKPVFATTWLSETDKSKIASGKLVLYEFVADWSDPCKNMERTALSNENISRIIEQRFVPIRITDRTREDGKNPKWVANLQKRYHVFALPTFIIVDKEGEQKGALIGNCSSLTVERFLNRIH